ncbi:MAG TPA: Na+:solute symporter [Acidobacteriota bacterium]|nr:Na+:solute symporter [Acidobacteriota bacterium]HQG91590.1 Na+:solute symporter [Acidobacteriota bacterium]
MILSALDWSIIVAYFLLSLVIGLAVSRRSGRSADEFFLSGRSMPWWLLGVSMVATTFSSDTPNLVTDMVRQNGVAGNWAWWAFLLTGMLTVFVYARLWRRSSVLTDLEFYELRYSGRAAAFLRGFRAVYLGAFFNVLVLATVSMALTKIAAVILHWPVGWTLLIAGIVTVIYSAIGGFSGVLLTDFFQFILAMAGAVAAAVVILGRPDVGGLSGLMANPVVAAKLNLIPDPGDGQTFLLLLVLPLAVQWWSVWYPGAEPGGGGYIAQRMLAARSEGGAVAATLFFNFAHYALRPWPWILVALASLVVFPDLASLQQAFPHADPGLIRHDFAYPAMLSFMPAGLLGLVTASLLAAYMSTVATHLNWGSSYLVNDLYRRFFRPDAGERRLVLVGRLATVGLMAVTSIVTLLLENALQAFQILLQIGAGTGLLFILRWFWWRVNAASEITAMVTSFLVAVYFQLVHPHTGLPAVGVPVQLVAGVAVTTVAWLAAAWLGPATDPAVLRSFYRKVHPGGPGWRRVLDEARRNGETLAAPGGPGWDVPHGILCMFLGCVTIYCALFATGNWIYGRTVPAVILSAVAVSVATLLALVWRRRPSTLT